MGIPNPLILFDNHFHGYRRRYPYATRLAIAAGLGYSGYELSRLEPEDDAAWEEAGTALRQSGLQHSGLYVVIKGAADDEVDRPDAELARLRRIVERLAALTPAPYLNLTIGSVPGRGAGAFHESGSARAEPRHWGRAARIVRAADHLLAAHGLRGNLYNHVWFILDTPQAMLRLLETARVRVLRPGLASFHAHFHQGVPDPAELLALPGMERLGYVALLNAWPRPEPFRTVALDAGQIDVAGLLALLWQRGYTGPLVFQAYDLGGDPYVTARRSIAYVREIWARFQRNPALSPVGPGLPPD